MSARGTAFVFTHNNYTATTLADLHALFDTLVASGDLLYGIVGKEVAPTTGTHHLQGYVQFVSRRRIGSIRSLLRGAHVEVARGDVDANYTYCSKGGDYFEFGDKSKCVSQGKRTDFDRFKDWVKAQPRYPSDAAIAEEWTSLYCRYGKRLTDLRDLLYPRSVLETAPVREGWQSELEQVLDEGPEDDRKIMFYCDPEGGKGKTWFIRKYLSEHDDAQLLGVGKRDDIAHALDPTKRVFFFNVPRGSMQYMQYGVLESIKDRLIFSPKYNARAKVLVHNPHVIVFCNEEPDEEALTADRYDIHYL